jgi:UDP-N-acetylglucosamine pyrophosphorylase
MANPSELYRIPNGTGDLIARLVEMNLLKHIVDAGVEYIEVVASNSLLDPMIDCLSLGYAHTRKLDCLAKAIDGVAYPEHTRILDLGD